VQIAFLLGLPINVAEVAVGFEPLPGEEIRGATVLKRVEDLIKIHC
jgi:hypothetical protein